MKTFAMEFVVGEREEQKEGDSLDAVAVKDLTIVIGALTNPKETMAMKSLSKDERKKVDLVHQTMCSFNKKRLLQLSETVPAFKKAY